VAAKGGLRLGSISQIARFGDTSDESTKSRQSVISSSRLSLPVPRSALSLTRFHPALYQHTNFRCPFCSILKKKAAIHDYRLF
jgi:hypothetical protein